MTTRADRLTPDPTDRPDTTGPVLEGSTPSGAHSHSPGNGGKHGSAPRRRWRWPWGVLAAWFVVAGFLCAQAGNLGSVVEDGAAAYLPSGSQSHQVNALTERFGDEPTLPAAIVWSREGGLTTQDRQAIATTTEELRRELVGEVTSTGVVGPIPSGDGVATQVVVPIKGLDSGHSTDVVNQIRGQLNPPAGITARVTGPAGIQADMKGALGAIDVMLIAVTSLLILVILFAVYRSILLPFVVIGVAGMALGASQGLLYLLIKAGVLTMGSEVQGIVSVLVLGCATDYAMLLIARFDQNLRAGMDRGAALTLSWRNCLEPIVASASTVVLGLLCLLLSSLGLNRQLGPAAAIGVVFAMVAMLTLMPAAIALLGRTMFWPRRQAPTPTRPVHRSRLARLLLGHPRAVWLTAAGLLAVCALAVTGLRVGAMTDNDQVLGAGVESRLGQQTLDSHFPSSSSSPVTIVVDQTQQGEAANLIRSTPGVASVRIWRGTQAGPTHEPVVVDGRVRFDAFLTSAADSTAAEDTVNGLRERLQTIPDARALVGGQTAIKVDFNQAAVDDRRGLVLLAVVVFLVVSVLLRSPVAGALVIASVILSFFASLGVATLVFRHAFHFPGVDATFPIHAFVFLVALGVDYSIFLMSRVRERVQEKGSTTGVVTGLTETSSVITSAGIVLAATFAALALVPLALMTELAFIVAFGILLDTLIVRTLLVPALAIDLGDRTWWPTKPPRDELA